MKKQIVTMLCGAVAVALAVPAFSATTTLSGQLRTQGVVQQVGPSLDKSSTYRKFVSERLNPKLTVAVNDMVSVVYAGEIDLDWGYNDTRTVGYDGAQSGDGMNLETKDLYATVKLGGDYNLSFTAGLQPVGDGIQNMYLRDDIAGLTVSGKAGSVDLNAGWLKIAETGASIGSGTPTWSDKADETKPSATPTPGDITSYAKNDDIDIYFVKAGFVPAEGSKAGVELYAQYNQGATKGSGQDLYTIGLTGATKVAGFGVDAFLAIQSGTDKAAAGDVDRSAYAASALVSQKFSDNLSGNVRFIYKSADTSKKDNNSWWAQYIGTPGVGGGANLAFVGSNQPILMTNGYKTSFGGFTDDLVALNANKYGLISLIANVDYNMAPYYVKGALGYHMAASKKVDGNSATELDGTTFGTELFGQVGTKIADGANVYVRASYAIMGDAWNTAANDNPYNCWFLAVGMDVPF